MGGMYNPKVLLLSLNYLGIVTASLGMLFFMPQIIKSLGDLMICGMISMVVWGFISDHSTSGDGTCWGHAWSPRSGSSSPA